MLFVFWFFKFKSKDGRKIKIREGMSVYFNTERCSKTKKNQASL